MDPEKNQALFDVGIADITAAGMTIVQDAKTLTLSRFESNGRLAMMSRMSPAFEVTSVYTLDEADAPAESAASAGWARWDGESLVVTQDERPNRRSMLSLSDGELRIETRWHVGQSRTNTVVLVYQKQP